MKKIKPSDFLLLLLYSPGYTGTFCEPINGRTKITKMLFVFEKEYAKRFKLNDLMLIQDIQSAFKFEPWNYGPMSKEVLKNIDFFKNIGFINSKPSHGETLSSEEVDEILSYEDDEMEDFQLEEYQSEIFWLTSLGRKFIEETKKYDNLSTEQKIILQEFKTQFNKVKTIDILRYVYKNPKYEYYISKSVIKDKIC